MSKDSKISPSQPCIEEQVQALLYWYLIREKNFTERELARLAGTSQSYINKIKNGQTSFKSLNTIYEILKGAEVLPCGDSRAKTARLLLFG